MFEEFNQPYDTEGFEERLEVCDSLDELKKEILPLLLSQKKQWEKKINQIIKEELRCTQTEFERISGFSRQSIYKWCKGSIPKRREHFLKISLAAGYGIDEINDLLHKYGRLPALYSKTLEDCVCMYVFFNYPREQRALKYDAIVSELKESVEKQTACKEVKDTRVLEKELEEIHTDEKLKEFISQNASSFATAYRKLHTRILEIVEEKSRLKSKSINNMATGQEWSRSLLQTVYDIKNGEWYPTRNKLISLGIHLCMSRAEIDTMLITAGMKPLYVKNLFENVIVYILTNAELEDVFKTDSENYDIDVLAEMAKEVFDELDMGELNFFLRELPGKAEEWEMDL